MPRSPDELLVQVYRRSRQIRDRRRYGTAAGTTTFALVTIAVMLSSLTGTVVPPEPGAPRLPEQPQAVGPGEVSGDPPAPGPCSCEGAPSPSPRGPAGPGDPPSPREREEFHLAFASDRDGDFDIYTMRADGSAVRRLTNDPADERDPEWSPDGRRIVFVRMDPEVTGFGSIHTMEADGTDERFVAHGLAPKWSPDGTMLAYHTHPIIYGQPSGQLWIVGADGSSKRPIAADAGDASWARDGSHLITGMRVQGRVNVYALSLDGSTRTQLSDDPAYACQPDVSPDGGRIAYVSSLPTRLHVMASDGSSVTSLTRSDGWEFAPSWSADGALLAFERDPDSDLHQAGGVRAGAGSAPSRIVIARADGSGEVTLAGRSYSDADPSFGPRRP